MKIHLSDIQIFLQFQFLLLKSNSHSCFYLNCTFCFHFYNCCLPAHTSSLCLPPFCVSLQGNIGVRSMWCEQWLFLRGGIRAIFLLSSLSLCCLIFFNDEHENAKAITLKNKQKGNTFKRSQQDSTAEHPALQCLHPTWSQPRGAGRFPHSPSCRTFATGEQWALGLIQAASARSGGCAPPPSACVCDKNRAEMKLACDGSCRFYQKRPLDVRGSLWAQISLYYFWFWGKDEYQCYLFIIQFLRFVFVVPVLLWVNKYQNFVRKPFQK